MNREASKMGSLQYVLITPARNEAAYIEKTIQSMIAQTILPARWVIVSDGSTDGTDEIVEKYAQRYSWIILAQTPRRERRHFAGKVYAFNTGREQLKDLDYDLIGNLDGDVSFEPDYFEYLLDQFQQNGQLGIAGTNYFESALRYDYRYSSAND